MKKIMKVLDPGSVYPFSTPDERENNLFFDIETTGLSARGSFLYLIGAAYYQQGCWRLSQWFNDDGESEAAILQEFLGFASGFQRLIHYNGSGFDLPYIRQRCEHFHIPCTLPQLLQVDLYKIVRGCRDLLGLSGLKQKDVEDFFHISRREFQPGGDLIRTYYLYLKLQDTKREQLLLLHNEDDVSGLLSISNLLSLQDLFQGNYTIESVKADAGQLQLHLHLQGVLPTLRRSNGYCRMDIKGQRVTFTIPIIDGRIRSYYSNYRDYYYLPAEDTAIHKTLAAYVSRDARTKATPLTCYTWVQYRRDLLTSDTIRDYVRSLLHTF